MAFKLVRVADENFEDYFEFLTERISNIEAEKELEKEEMLAKIDEKYSIRLSKFELALDGISTIKEIEVPDEEEQLEETENLGE